MGCACQSMRGVESLCSRRSRLSPATGHFALYPLPVRPPQPWPRGTAHIGAKPVPSPPASTRCFGAEPAAEVRVGTKGGRPHARGPDPRRHAVEPVRSRQDRVKLRRVGSGRVLFHQERVWAAACACIACPQGLHSISSARGRTAPSQRSPCAHLPPATQPKGGGHVGPFTPRS